MIGHFPLLAISNDTPGRSDYTGKLIMTDSASSPSGTGASTTSASGTSPGTGRIGFSADVKPHAYDPAANPELFEGVMARRVVAFVIDIVIIAVPLIAASVFIFVLGIVTFGLGWALYWLLSPASVIWALVYYGITLGGPASATIGMRAMEIEMRTWYGAPAYFVLGAVHAVVFWISVSVLSPFILVVGFFNTRRRLLHDLLVGTVLINNANRAALLRARAVR
jgi:uncharacterized RDD family membrane protein YckC